MSDAVFMGSPILARVGKLTGESKYFDMCARNFEFIKKLTMRSDHIYRHSPLDEAAWGRGNGFPALGLALTLSDLPEDHPAYASILRDYRDHMAAMAKVQDFTGHWRQVVDHSGSYRELTSTCMITFAMARGIRRGWLDPKYREHVERGWAAISGRVASDGGLIDVCTGTGKQKSLRDYFNRTAILGKDDRGGAMALQAALEVHRLHQD
jgi:unsaturated rhamnogalacturonyl hydrolase